jgi:dienelactone hydrolase
MNEGGMTRPEWNMVEWAKVPAWDPTSDAPVVGVESIYFQGVPYRGRATRLFAYYGLPAVAQHEKVPAMVLVHGGGGSALADWVKLWNARGYAALAFDHGGHIPIGRHSAWQKNPDGGPPRDDWFQADDPSEDQWMYHAVEATLRAHSLLGSLPGVDPARIGVTGVSWGGVVSCLVAALDPRLRLAVPVYGCGYICEDLGLGTQFVGRSGSVEKVARWRALWDPAHYLPEVKIPMLWVNGTNDAAFTPPSWQMSYRAAPGPRALCLRVRMPHGHDGPGESPEEIRVFADSLLCKAPPLIRIVRQGSEREDVWAEYEAPAPIRSAELVFTTDQGPWQERYWQQTPAVVTAGRVIASLPAQATAWYLNLIDDRGAMVSSEHETRLA